MQASIESSPIDRSIPKPSFNDPLWTVDPKRRRVDRASENSLSRLPNDSIDYQPLDGRRSSARSDLFDPSMTPNYESPGTSSSSSGGQSSLPSFHHRPSFGHAPSSTLSYSRQPSPTMYQRQPLLQQRPLGAPYGPPPLPPPGHVSEGLVSHRQSFSYEDPQQYDRNTARHDTHRQGDDRRYSLMPDQRHLPDPGFYQHQNYNQYTFQSSSGVNDGQFQRKRRGNLPKEATSQLKAWFNAHRDSPYPSEDEKYALCSSTGLTLNQVRTVSIFWELQVPIKFQPSFNRLSDVFQLSFSRITCLSCSIASNSYPSFTSHLSHLMSMSSSSC